MDKWRKDAEGVKSLGEATHLTDALVSTIQPTACQGYTMEALAPSSKTHDMRRPSFDAEPCAAA